MTRFFFAPEGPRRLALVRIALGLVLCWEAASHWRYAVELYSSYGPAMPLFAARPATVGNAPQSDADRSAIARPRFRIPVPSPGLAVMFQSGLLFAALGVALGWQTRFSLLLSLVLFAWLGPLDLAATFAKHPVIMLHLALLLCFSRGGGAWSVDAWSRGHAVSCRLSAAWPRRLIQILVCTIYLGAALTKLRTPSFATGELLEFSLLDDDWGGGRFGHWLVTRPHLPLVLSQATLLIELLFPCLVWTRRLRWPMLALACALHAGMGLALTLGTFSPTMFAALLAFLDERDLDRIPWLRQIGSDKGIAATVSATVRRLISFVAYATVGIMVVAGGTVLQRQCDWYGAFGVRSPAEVARFSEIADGRVADMLAGRLPAFEDYFHRISFGTRVGHHDLFGESRQFRRGQRVYALAQLVLPHPSLLLEGLLIAPNGEEVARFSHRIASGVTHTLDGFELTAELPVGRYRVILQVEGVEFLEREIEILAE